MKKLLIILFFCLLPLALQAQTRSVKLSWAKSASSFWKDSAGAAVIISQVEVGVTTPFTEMSEEGQGIPPLFQQKFPYTGVDSLEIGQHVAALGGGPYYAWIRVHSSSGLASAWVKSATFTFGPVPPASFKVTVGAAIILPPPPPPLDPLPVITWANLTTGQILAGTVSLTGNVTSVHGVKQTELYVDGIRRSNLELTAPYTFIWATTEVADGPHQFMLKITDLIGQSALSVIVTATVKNAVATIDRDATFEWTAPTINADGTPLLDLAGYQLYKASSPSGPFLPQGDVLPGTTRGLLELADGTHYFAVKAVDLAGNQSVLSNIVSKSIGP